MGVSDLPRSVCHGEDDLLEVSENQRPHIQHHVDREREGERKGRKEGRKEGRKVRGLVYEERED